MSALVLTKREACSLMGISRWRLQQEMREKRLKVLRLGYRTLRIPRAEVDRWIERRAR